jgi:hypothetical protein
MDGAFAWKMAQRLQSAGGLKVDFCAARDGFGSIPTQVLHRSTPAEHNRRAFRRIRSRYEPLLKTRHQLPPNLLRLGSVTAPYLPADRDVCRTADPRRKWTGGNDNRALLLTAKVGQSWHLRELGAHSLRYRMPSVSRSHLRGRRGKNWKADCVQQYRSYFA